MKQQDKAFMAVGGSVVTALALATGIYLFGSNDSTTAQSSTPATTTSSGATASAPDEEATSTGTTATTNTTSSTTSSTYKDGTYSATVSYYVPHGATNNLTAKVTVSSNKITAVTVNDNYSDNESAMYIDSFESAIKSAVIGQDVGSLSLSRVGGATLTTQAFDDALTTIRNDAKA